MGSQPVPVTLVCRLEMIARGVRAAARCLLALSGRWTSAARWQRQVLTRFNTDIDLYVPRGTSVGTVVFVHGLSVLGHRDPRVEQLGGALATAGFRQCS